CFLTAGTFFGGLLGHSFSLLVKSGWPVPQTINALPEFEWSTFAVGTGAAALGAALAYWLALAKPTFDWDWRAKHPGLEKVFESDFGWKPAVAWMTGSVIGLAGLIGGVFDRKVVDGAVEAAPRWARRAGDAGSRLATGLVNDYV